MIEKHKSIPEIVRTLLGGGFEYLCADFNLALFYFQQRFPRGSAVTFRSPFWRNEKLGYTKLHGSLIIYMYFDQDHFWIHWLFIGTSCRES